MKTKLPLLLSVITLTGGAFAGPADGAAFAIRHAHEATQANQTVAVTNSNSGPVTYVASPSGKGGSVVAQNNRGATNIALFKSKKNSSECSSCKADAQKR